jgi:hypothetical protein
MKKLYYLLLIPLIIIGCNESALQEPSNISNVSAKADTGAVTVYWNIPPDSNLTYVKVWTKKYPNNPDSDQVISTKASIYADSARINKLLNKYEYTFKVQPFNNSSDHIKGKGGKVFTTNAVKPVRRPIKTVINDAFAKKISVDPSMTSSPTVDLSNDNTTFLFDDDISTFWQMDWTIGKPPPYKITINFKKPTAVGALKYTFRQNGDFRGVPDQLGIAISKDGQNWNMVWESETGLPTDPTDGVHKLHFDKNYTSKHFRVLILKIHTPGSNFADLAGLSLYKMSIEKVDEEKKAEQNYSEPYR